jgi:hypothetical protein
VGNYERVVNLVIEKRTFAYTSCIATLGVRAQSYFDGRLEDELTTTQTFSIREPPGRAGPNY